MATPQVDPYQAQSRKSSTMLFVGLIVLALMGGFALGKGGFLNRSGEIAGEGQRISLEASGDSKPVQIQVPEEPLDLPVQLGFDPTMPDLRQGHQPDPGPQVADKMPQEVREWLLHLERTESERNRMTKAQLGSVLGMMTGFGGGGSLEALANEALTGEEATVQEYDPSKRERAQGETAAIRKSWKDLNAYFNSKQPPAECVPIKNAYEQCLGETSAMMLDILGQLEKAESDPQAALNGLISMMGTSEGKIDVAAKQTDGMVGQICHKYDTWKWFSISGDIGGGLGALGGLGGGLGDLGGMLGGG